MLAPFKALLFLGLTTLIVLGSPAPAGQARRIFDKNRSLQPKLFDARRTTNAERLANNLPPIRPRKLWGTDVPTRLCALILTLPRRWCHWSSDSQQGQGIPVVGVGHYLIVEYYRRLI